MCYGQRKHAPCRHQNFPQKKPQTWQYLVTKGVTANDDRLGPAGNKTGNHLAEDGLTEHCAAQDVTDGAVGTQPHLLQVELCQHTHTNTSKKGQQAVSPAGLMLCSIQFCSRWYLCARKSPLVLRKSPLSPNLLQIEPCQHTQIHFVFRTVFKVNKLSHWLNTL